MKLINFIILRCTINTKNTMTLLKWFKYNPSLLELSKVDTQFLVTLHFYEVNTTWLEPTVKRSSRSEDLAGARLLIHVSISQKCSATKDWVSTLDNSNGGGLCLSQLSNLGSIFLLII